jgi:hypothetical protein
MKRTDTITRTKLNAWLLTWEGTQGPALERDKKIVAIVDARKTDAFIAALVDVLYCRSVGSAYDMSFIANKRALRERQYKHFNTPPSRILFGRNPCIYARRVSALTVERNETQQTEHLRWTEPAVLGNASTVGSIVERSPARELEHVRSCQPLSCELYAPA